MVLELFFPLSLFYYCHPEFQEHLLAGNSLPTGFLASCLCPSTLSCNSAARSTPQELTTVLQKTLPWHPPRLGNEGSRACSHHPRSLTWSLPPLPVHFPALLTSPSPLWCSQFLPDTMLFTTHIPLLGCPLQLGSGGSLCISYAPGPTASGPFSRFPLI